MRLDLTLTSGDLEHDEMTRAWCRLVKRLNRNKPRRAPLIYVAQAARSHGDGGFHLHALLWEYLLGEHVKLARPILRVVRWVQNLHMLKPASG